MKNPNEWYSRQYMDFIAILLIAAGAWTAIIFLPTAPFFAFLFFSLMGGLGIEGDNNKTVKLSLISYWVLCFVGYPNLVVK